MFRIMTTFRDFLRTWGSPERTFAASDQQARAYRYQILWDLYAGNAFSDKRIWAEYRRAYALYRQTRQVWDIVHQVVEFYAHHIWSGSLSLDGRELPGAIPPAVPVAPDTPDALRVAIGQLFQWWNFQSLMTIIPRYTAATGELLVEIVDDPERGKVGLNLVWPAFVKEITLDGMGNVKSYTIEYMARDAETGRSFLYTRQVTKEAFITLRDGRPWSTTQAPAPADTTQSSPVLLPEESGSPETPNPYGFVPAVWFRHHAMIGERGEPAIFGVMQQLDEINQLLSHWLDKAHTILQSPILVSGQTGASLGSALRKIGKLGDAVKRGFTEEEAPELSERESISILEVPQGSGVQSMQMPATEAAEIVDRLIANIEAKLPEVTLYRQLRNMTQITGAGALRALGDVDRKVRAVAAGYDQQLIKLLQMSIAVAGFRFAEGSGAWQERTQQQRKFARFSLDSYANGELDFDILPRSIVAEALSERYQTLVMKKAAVPIIPDRVIAVEAGYPPEMVDEWLAEREATAAPPPQQQPQQPQGNGEVTPEERMALLKAIPGRPGAPPDGPQRGAPVQNRRRGT
jgi:hypothetical protein